MRSDFPTSDRAPADAAGLAEGPATAGTSPADEERPPRHGGRGRRRRLIVVAAVVAVVLIAAVVGVVALRGDDDDTSTSASTSSTAVGTSTTLSTATTTPGPAATVGPPATTIPAPGGLPDDPNGYAVATLTAWQQGDITTLAELVVPSVAAFLAARSPREGSWGDPQLEGAAGSTYSTWTRPEIQFVVRIGNELADAGEPHAVREAFFLPGPGRVAIWSVTTQDEATALQAQVDQGHQPWLVDPALVASAYAQAAFGWQDAIVAMTQPDRYQVTDRASGATATFVLSQPARPGLAGIWAVSRAGSV